jgi:putative flavoprotein involved in K+ transport
VKKEYDVVIVGAGPAGVGVGSILKQMGLSNFVILERNSVGSTFTKWPKEMKLLTPSFPGHGFGLLDLNAVVPDTSPGYSYQSEHLSGEEYGEYLQAIANHFELPIKLGIDVKEMNKTVDGFILNTNKGEFVCRYVVWAGGEFQYPNLQPFEGGELCLHNSKVTSWNDLEGEEHFIIGGYESGIDAAIHLSRLGKDVTVLAREATWTNDNPDPSISLSPFTCDRLAELFDFEQLILRENSEVIKVEKEEDYFQIYLSNGEKLESSTQPILATGFKSSLSLILEHFYWDEENHFELTNLDESTVSEGLFLVGPQVRHDPIIFCFIYKFRQRFAIVAKEICDRLEIEVSEELIKFYRRSNMFLDDLSCCGNECVC